MHFAIGTHHSHDQAVVEGMHTSIVDGSRLKATALSWVVLGVFRCSSYIIWAREEHYFVACRWGKALGCQWEGHSLLILISELFLKPQHLCGWSGQVLVNDIPRKLVVRELAMIIPLRSRVVRLPLVGNANFSGTFLVQILLTTYQLMLVFYLCLAACRHKVFHY